VSRNEGIIHFLFEKQRIKKQSNARHNMLALVIGVSSYAFRSIKKQNNARHNMIVLVVGLKQTL
jgi:cbb3-type cytochrome oxidase subunit 3